jgi:cytochrome c2
MQALATKRERRGESISQAAREAESTVPREGAEDQKGRHSRKRAANLAVVKTLKGRERHGPDLSGCVGRKAHEGIGFGRPARGGTP